ncbi:alpha-1,2-fucosyltransferase [Moorena sp. SIO3H5]|uniref:alpha-1,2-fucosyltransferase n=1 Tax=Moorena sp. SIO3H5 TaxID=2607834 RepID=UPI0025E6E19D|nr:alpha-1,2-fucosyltransferase [Moorena sp. SIO3H5]
MSNQDTSSEIIKTSNYNSKTEADRAFALLDSFKNDNEDIESSLDNENLSDIQPVLTMSSLGKFGRFGNQIFQYAFLKVCAKNSGAKVECPDWIGQTIFGHNDAPISKRLPPAIEYEDLAKSLFNVVPEFIPYLEKSADAKSYLFGSEVLEIGLSNLDIWGVFHFHTRCLKPYQQYFRSLFQPVSDLKFTLEEGLNNLRSKGKTIVGIHIRRGDYIKQPRLGFTLVFPTQWYCEWLEGIWEQLEDPVLLLCSDDIDSIIGDFEKFSPVTTRDLNIRLPESMKDLDLDFYIDFFMLSKCDVVCTSNSTFSFAACMLNDRAKMFFRPHWDFSTKFKAFDPWDSQPVLWIGDKQPRLHKSLAEIIYFTYSTQGIWVMLKSIFIYLPKSLIRGWAIRVYLGYQIESMIGVFKTLLSILSWRSAWKR